MVSGFPFCLAGIRLVRTESTSPLPLHLTAVFPSLRCGFFLGFFSSFLLRLFSGLFRSLFGLLLRHPLGLFLGEYFRLPLCGLLGGLFSA
ncbi:hypothetical protein BOC59_02595 [Burkholderia pseudomallei]|nr:hypothetical protein BOC59_02595 [Burkholderia pseudomallei]